MSGFLGKLFSPLLILCVMILVAAILGFMTLSIVESLVSDARAQAIKETNAVWQVEIERSNAQVEKQIAQNLRETMAAQNAARDQIASAEDRARQLEIANAALPDSGRCGLSIERGRLLDNQ